MTLPGVTIFDDPEIDGLNGRQRNFAFEYVKDYNASQAAARAGYSALTAGQQGHALLKNPKIQALIRRERAELRERVGVDRDWIAQRLMRIADVSVKDVAEWDGKSEIGKRSFITAIGSAELDDRSAYAISEISDTDKGVKIKLGERTKALAELAKLLGLVTEKVEHSGTVASVPFNPETLSPAALAAYKTLLIEMVKNDA